MTFHRDLGARLSELEPVNPNLRGQYEQALKDVFERKLSTAGKVFIACVGAMSIVIAVFLGSLAVAQGELPVLARIGLAGGAAFAALATKSRRQPGESGALTPKSRNCSLSQRKPRL